MSGESSEEKNLPASEKKLRDARNKGQIAKAPDMVTAFTAVTLLGYVFGASGWIGERLRTAMLATGDAVAMPFDEATRVLLPALASVIAQVVGPALALGVLSVVVASVLVNGGFMLTLEPLTPKFSNLDPIKGVGKLFALKGFIELAKSIVKAVVLGVVAVELALGAAGTLVQLPFCGQGCVGRTVWDMLRPLVEAACGMYVVSGGFDMLLQKWLFKHEMKMSATEQKRERKDQDGNPHVRGAQRSIRREAATAEKLGLGQATVLIGGNAAAIGVRYVKDGNGFPTVVCRARDGASAATMAEEARRAGIPLYWDDALSAAMSAVLRSGMHVKVEFFQDVARALFASGAIRS